MRKTQLEGRDTGDTERLVLRVTVEYIPLNSQSQHIQNNIMA